MFSVLRKLAFFVVLVCCMPLAVCAGDDVEDVAGDSGDTCLDALDCPPGFECAINLVDPSAPGQCEPVMTMASCTSDEDCFRGEECFQGLCITDSSPEPDPSPESSPEPNPEMMSPDPQPEMMPDVQPDDTGACMGNEDCQTFEECCEGVCVNRGDCVEAVPCASQGQACLLGEGENLVDQGSFYCGRLDDDSDEGVCMAKCTAAFSPDNCASGSYCWEVGDTLNPVNLCLPTQCDSSNQCLGVGADGEDGTCIRFENNAGLCFTAGILQEGQSCNLDGTTSVDRCDVDLFCVATDDISRTGQCRPLCEMWQPNQACPVGSACGLLTLETGVCLNTTATGRQPFDNCTPTLDWCSQGVRCFETGTPPSTQNFCLSYCRPNGSDCNSVNFQGLPTVCETVFVDSNMETVDNVGLCFPPQ